MKHILLKSWLMLVCLLVGVGSAWAETYEKVTTAPADWSGEYVVTVQNGEDLLAWTGIDAGQCRETVTLTDGKIVSSNLIAITVEALDDGGYSVKVNGGDNDGKYISSGTSAPAYSNGLKFVSSPVRVDFAMNDNGSVAMSQTIGTSGIMYFIYNKNTGTSNERFRFYKDSNYGASNYLTPILYKKSESGETVNVNVTGVSLNATSKTLAEGESFTLTATVAPTNATNKSVTWSSSDVEVATVSKGEVTAVGPGKATITVKTADGNYTATCEVTVEATPEPDEYVFLFAPAGSDSDSSSSLSATTALNKAFAEGYEYISSITAERVYPARNSLGYGVKFGSSSAAGTITINLKKAVPATYIIVSAAAYGDTEGQQGFKINGTSVEMSAAQNKVYCEYAVKLDGSDLSTITLTQNAANKGRIYVESIKLIKEDTYYASCSRKLTAQDAGAYYATFSSDKVTFFPDDYIVSAVGVENGQLYQFDNDEAFDEDIVEINGEDVVGYYVPANTGVLITSLENIVNYYTVDGITPSNDVEAVNMLRPATAAMEGDYKFYKLAYDDYEAKTALGFYYGAEGGAAFTCKTGSAYLAVPTPLAAKGFALNGGVTNIQSVNKAAQNNVMFNLAGQRILNANGIVIKNGKKFVK